MPSSPQHNYRLADTVENRQKISQLAELLRTLFEKPVYRTVATYMTHVSELQDAHDAIIRCAHGSQAFHLAQRNATQVYRAAVKYASKNSLPHPNELLRACGYQV